VLDLFAWFRRKGGQRQISPAGRRRSIAQPVNAPMFTGRVEPMSYQRGQPQNRNDPRARQDSYQVPQPDPHPDSYQHPHQDSHPDSYPDPQQHPRQDPRQDPRLDARATYRDPRQQSHQQPRQAPPPASRQDARQEPRQDARYDSQREQGRHAQADAGRQRAVQSDASWHPSSHGFLAAHGVERSFVGRKVVKGVSLYVRRGEAVGLLGPNGAGKTTVFYMITGLITADRGRIELDGHDVTTLPMYQRARLGIGYLPQEASIFRGLNVEENIRAVLEVVEPSKKRREYDLDALLEEFNITRLRKTPSIALSGGERRRVEIARALATRPNYMLLDEPFAGIDPIAVGDIQALVRHLTQRGIGVLITDHNVRETLGLTDRAYIIYSGEVLMEGRAEDIVNNPDVRRLYLGNEFRM
jgi:lipopolysaccharide export system ATP-binding protein